MMKKNLLTTSIILSVSVLQGVAMAEVPFSTQEHVYICGNECSLSLFTPVGTRVAGIWDYSDTHAVADELITIENFAPYPNGMSLFNWDGTISYNKGAIFKNNTTIPNIMWEGLIGSTIYTFRYGTTSFNGDTLFENNGSRYDGGGMVDVDASTYFNQKVTFKSNEALRNGGAVGHTSGNLFFIGDAEFNNNKATGINADGIPSGGEGGAIFANVVYPSIDIYEEYKADLSSEDLLIYEGPLNYFYSNIYEIKTINDMQSEIDRLYDGNTTGPDYYYNVEVLDIHTEKSDVQFDGKATFTENQAGSHGGAISGNLSDFTFNGDALFHKNSAGNTPETLGGDGGAIFFRGANFTHDGETIKRFTPDMIFNQAATFTENTATINGGAVSSQLSRIIFNGDTLFLNNTAENVGGAVFSNESQIEFNGKTTFQENTALRGGALYMANSELTLNQDAKNKITFIGNKASELGDDVYLDNSALRVTGDYDLAFTGTVYGNYEDDQQNLIEGNHFVKEGNGQLFMLGEKNSTGKSRIKSGSVQAWSDANKVNFDASDFTIDSGASLVTNQGTIDGNVNNAGTFQLQQSQLGAADYRISGDVTNSGTLTMNNGRAADKLTVAGNYSGDNGTFILDTTLNGDNSPTDKLVIEGNASGSTAVMVNNAGGSGAQTIDGLEIIHVGGTSTDKAFTQAGRIVAGAYDYSLVKGNISRTSPESWFLTSHLVKTKPEPEENNRPEAGSYATNLAAANTLFSMTLHDRLGETQYTDALTGEQKVTSMWLRTVGGHNRSRMEDGQNKTLANRYVIQMGGDLATWWGEGKQRAHLGLMAGYANQKSNTSNRHSGHSSKGKVDGYSTGLYATYYQNDANKSGLYVDSWLQYNWFDNEVNGQGIASESYKSRGMTGSLEAGYTYHVGGKDNQIYIQPQAQVTWMGVKAKEFREHNGTRVQGSGHNNVQTRLGVRAFLNGKSAIDEGSAREFEPFVEINWLHNTKQHGVILNGITRELDGSKNIGEVKMGVEGKINNNFNLWGNVAQQVGSEGYSDTQATLGIKYLF